MAYDDSSFYGDLIVDEYDEQNNFMNPPSSFGFLVYYLLGHSFDMMSDMCNQFMNDTSILTCAGKNLDNIWGVEYDMIRPKIQREREYLLFEDKATKSDHNDDYTTLEGKFSVTRGAVSTSVFGQRNQNTVQIGEKYSDDFKVEVAIVEFPNSLDDFFFILKNESGTEKSISLSSIASANNITLTKIEGVVSLYADSVLMVEESVSGSTFQILFRMPSSHRFSFDDLKITSLTPQLSAMTDDEYRIYLYLRNCRLMTREDIEINMNKAFGFDDYTVYFTEETTYLTATDHLSYSATVTDTSNLSKNNDDTSNDYLVNLGSSDSNVHLLEGNLSTGEEFVEVINIPYQGWDSNFLAFMEQYISVKGDLRIREYNL